MTSIDDIKALWDEELTRTSDALLMNLRAHAVTQEQMDKSAEDQRKAILGYWLFKRSLERANEIEELWKR